MKTIGFILLACIAYMMLHLTVKTFKMKRMIKKSSDDLRAIFHKSSNFCYYAKATEELKRRGEDISFTFPIFLTMTLSSGVKSMIGRGCLQIYFGDKLPNINLSEDWSPEDRQKLQNIEKELDEKCYP